MAADLPEFAGVASDDGSSASKLVDGSNHVPSICDNVLYHIYTTGAGMPAKDLPIWIELVKAIPNVVTAITAIVGVSIAACGLNKWRAETIGKRKTELAEQALIAFYEARDVFVWVRSRGIFGGEGESRTPDDGEGKTQQRKRNTYFVPIERLKSEKELFARLQSLRYAFVAHFGEATREPFEAITSVHHDILTTASVLIQITYDDEGIGHRVDEGEEALRSKIGWGRAQRPDDIDVKIDKAVRDIENVCRPVLAGAP